MRPGHELRNPVVGVQGGATALPEVQAIEREFWRERYIVILVSLPFGDPKLFLHGFQLAEEYDPYKNRDEESKYVEPKTHSLPKILVICLALFAFCLGLGAAIYGIKRGDYLSPLLILVCFPICWLGLSLIVSDACPPFLDRLYSALPVCHYEAENGW